MSIRAFHGTFRACLSLLLFVAILPWSGAEAQDLEFPAIGVWNGFLGHTNVIECNSLSEDDVVYDIEIRSNDASAITTGWFELPSGGTLVSVINDYVDITDQIGTYVIEPSAGYEGLDTRLACRTVFYRWGTADFWKAVEYAFAIPVKNPLRGLVSGVFNSFNPEQTVQPVYNWLTVYNPGTTVFNADVDVYEGLNRSYSWDKSFQVANLAPGERRDYPLGHEDGQVVGIYQINPASNSQPYGAFLTRYSQVTPTYFNFAFALEPRQGSCSPGAVPISTFDPATNWVEIANVSDDAVEVDIVGRDQASNLVYSERRTIPAFSQHHIYVNAFLGMQNVGSVTVECTGGNNAESLVVESMFYGHIDTSPPYYVEWSYGSQAGGYVPQSGMRAGSAVNTSLGAANWNKVIDTSLTSSAVEVVVHDLQGDIANQCTRVLSPGGSVDVGLHEFVGYEFQGLVEILPYNTSLPFAAELIRVFPSDIASIGYILNIPCTYTQPSGVPSPSPTPSPTASPSPTPTSTPTPTPTPDERQEMLDDYEDEYLGSDVSDSTLAWSGNSASCNAGTVSSTAHTRVLRRINYFRRMAGLPDNITLNSTKNNKCQQAALMMQANNQLNHYPPSSWLCYTEDGYEAAGKSNLSLGWPSYHSTDAVTGQMEDSGVGNYFAGHRRWILYSRAQEMGHGSTTQAMCLWVIGDAGPSPSNLPAFIAWPPSGYVPASLVFDRWSFGIPDADFSGTSVSMYDSQGSPLTLSVNTLKNNEGYADNTIVWEPQGVNTSSSSDVSYEVRVENVLVGGVSKDYSYDVIIVQTVQGLSARGDIFELGVPPRAQSSS